LLSPVASPDDYRRESRSRWNHQAAGWERRRDALRRTTMAVSAWMVDAVDPQPGQTVLELAAGTGDTGFLAAELIQPGGTLIVSDFAPEMLATAQRRADELGITNARFKQIDAESIDVEAGSLDAVLCRWGYMLMADPETALRETRRVLKPNRRVALAAWAKPDENLWSVLGSRTLVRRGLMEVPDPSGPGQFAWARAAVIAEHFDAAGFTGHRIEPLDFAFAYPSFDAWWDTQRDLSSRFAAGVAAVEPQALAEVRDEVAQEAEPFTHPDGSLAIPARTWVAWAST
jgi:SAM-dependent methyltransferase